MPSSSPHFILNGLSVSRIRRLIPKKWKRSAPRLDVQTNFRTEDSVLETAFSDVSMIETLFLSLKEFASQGNLLKAFRTYSLIQFHVSNSASYGLILHPLSSLLVSCCNLRSLPQGKQLHAHIISLGFEQNLVLVPKLVTFYSTFSLLVDARIVTENSKFLHPLPWNMLISSYVRNGLCKEAILAYKKMLNRGIRPDNFTFPSVLKACSEESDLNFGREVHNSISASGLDWSLFVHNALVSMYGRIGELQVARALFDKMPKRDAVSWNTMITTYSSKGMWKEAFEIFESMSVEGAELNVITWNTIAAGCLRTGNFRRALELISQMKNSNHLDHVAVIIGLSACSYLKLINSGKEIHSVAIRSCCDEFENVRHALITMYSRCKDLKHSYVVFGMTVTKSTVTWNSMLSGYTHLDKYEEASFLFREMLLSEIEPNYVTIASILSLCARIANLQHGKEFHCYIMKHEGFEDYLLLWNALVDMYGRSGKILEAKRVFDSLKMRDAVTYTSLMAGYGMQGEGKAALQLFEEMNRLQIKPDQITMVAILSACSHSGLIKQGEMYFRKMQSSYDLTPELEHFSCMVDLYGRAGLLYKAKEIIIKMPFRPNAAMWATLIGACRIHGNTVVGEWAAEKLLAMRPDHSGYYVLIANMYAAASCWEKLAKVRTFMRDLGVQKAPGCTWVDLGNGFSPFLVWDTSNPLSQEIYSLLDGLTELIKDAGYVESEDFSFGDGGFIGPGEFSCTSYIQSATLIPKNAYGDSMLEIIHVGASTGSVVKEEKTEAWGGETYDRDDFDVNCKSLVGEGVVNVPEIKFPLPYRPKSVFPHDCL